MSKWHTLAYELFGSLTDEQIQRFETAWEVRVPIKSATKEQRAALDKWFQAKGLLSPGFDPLVALYERGGKEDLSNVEFGFDHGGIGRGTAGTYAVCLGWWIKRPDGSVDADTGYIIGTTDPSRRR